MTRTRLVRGGGPAFVGAVAVALLLTGCSGGASDGPSSHPSATASANPATSATSAPTPSPAPSGYLPVDSLGASEIPWDEVGPGWFLLAYDADTTDNASVFIGDFPDDNSDGGVFHYFAPENDDGMTLVSPAGEIYLAGSLSGQGPVAETLWDGGSVYLNRPTGFRMEEEGEGTVTAYDLATGSTREVVRGETYLPEEMTTAGRLVGWHWAEGTIVGGAVYGSDGSDFHKVCPSGSGSPTLAPDGHRTVCIELRTDGRSDVVLYDLDSGTREPIDVFKEGSYAYQLLGWWDSASVVVSRWEDGASLYWAYDVETKKLTEIDPRLPDGSQPSSFQGLGTYRLLWGADNRRAFIYGTDGDLRADLPCGISALSGDVALSLCGAAGGARMVTISRTDLVTGETLVVGEYRAGENDHVQVFPFPGSAPIEWWDSQLFQ